MIVASAHAILVKRDTRSTIGWVGLIWLSPVFGAIAYAVLGVNRIRSRATQLWAGQTRILHEMQGALPTPTRLQAAVGPEGSPLRSLATLVGEVTDRPLVDGNQIDVLAGGDEAYPRMLDAIAGAKRSIGLASYIFDNDPTGKIFAEALAAAVKRGVEVRVLVGGWHRGVVHRALDPQRAHHDGRAGLAILPTSVPIKLSPFEFLDRLTDLVPPPRKHRHRYHGVFAPNHKLRPAVTSLAIGNVGKRQEAATGGHWGDGHATEGCCDANPSHKPRSHDTSRIAWAKLLARVGEEFPLECRNCGGDIRLIAFITEPGRFAKSSATSASRSSRRRCRPRGRFGTRFSLDFRHPSGRSAPRRTAPHPNGHAQNPITTRSTLATTALTVLSFFSSARTACRLRRRSMIQPRAARPPVAVRPSDAGSGTA